MILIFLGHYTTLVYVFFSLSYTKNLKNPNKILIIIQRSNGDVFLSLSLINQLYEHYDYPQIDLLVNDDTLPVARILPYVNCIHTFSYQKKKNTKMETREKN